MKKTLYFIKTFYKVGSGKLHLFIDIFHFIRILFLNETWFYHIPLPHLMEEEI